MDPKRNILTHLNVTERRSSIGYASILRRMSNMIHTQHSIGLDSLLFELTVESDQVASIQLTCRILSTVCTHFTETYVISAMA